MNVRNWLCRDKRLNEALAHLDAEVAKLRAAAGDDAPRKAGDQLKATFERFKRSAAAAIRQNERLVRELEASYRRTRRWGCALIALLAGLVVVRVAAAILVSGGAS